MNHICEPFSKQLVRYIHFYDTAEVLQRLATNALEVSVTRSHAHDTITIADITVPMTHAFGAIPDTTCEYDTWTRTWMFQTKRKLPDRMRAHMIQLYLTEAFVTYPDCAARICDIAICTLRDMKHILIDNGVGGIWSKKNDVMSISRFLCFLRSTDAFETLCAQMNHTEQLQQGTTE